MMRSRYRRERRTKTSPPTDEIVEHREFKDRVMSIVWDALPNLSNGQRVIIRDVFYGGKTLGSVAKKYDNTLDNVSAIYNDTITSLRRYLENFAASNGIRIPGRV